MYIYLILKSICYCILCTWFRRKSIKYKSVNVERVSYYNIYKYTTFVKCLKGDFLIKCLGKELDIPMPLIAAKFLPFVSLSYFCKDIYPFNATIIQASSDQIQSLWVTFKIAYLWEVFFVRRYLHVFSAKG